MEPSLTVRKDGEVFEKAFFNGKEGRDDFRNLYYLKNKIYARYTNYYYGWWHRLPFLAYVNTRLPKKFIDVMGVGRSLIQLTVDRLKPICPVENMWVVTNEKYISIVKEQIPDMPVNNILSERRLAIPHHVSLMPAGRSRRSIQLPTLW